ncbi:MAG TPA: hypothetical protein VFQ61_34455 [Polyangiaceae bacterium]|nr:hypothetical protein [Polyangiaceae bacterium]
MMWPALLLLAATSSAGPPLMAYAGSSPRPAECRSSADSGELWEQARGQAARRFCLLLARAYARLASAPGEALELARKAEALQPAAVEPRVVQGRAQLRLGDWDGAYTALASSVLQAGRPLGDVYALRELAVAAAQTGRLAEARSAYRSLVSRAGFIEEPAFAKRIALEAAPVLLQGNEADVSDAIVFLNEARRGVAVPGLSDLLVAELALCLDRAGKAEDAEIVLKELNGAWSLTRWFSERERVLLSKSLDHSGQALPKAEFNPLAPMLLEPELFAIIGYAAHITDPRLARTHLKAYLQAGGRAQDWARRQLQALGGESAPPAVPNASGGRGRNPARP